MHISRIMARWSFTFAVRIISASVCSSAILSGQTYTVTDLGTLAGQTSSSAVSINRCGQVIGTSGSLGFSWKGGVLTQLPPIAGETTSAATSLNNLGTVIGTCGSKTCIWKDGSVSELPYPAQKINDANEMAGQRVNQFGNFAAFRVDAAGQVTDLAPVNEQTVSSVSDINNEGHVIGEFWPNRNGSPFPQIFGALWTQAGMTTFAFVQIFTHTSAVNDTDQIVGASVTPANSSIGYLWQNGSFVALPRVNPLLPQGPIPRDINNAGVVVGRDLSIDRNGHAVLIDTKAAVLQAVDLNTVVQGASSWVLREATSINDRGQIAGTGELNGQTRAFLLNPAAGPLGSDLELRSRLSGSIVPGGTVDYDLTVTNLGPIASCSVTLTDVLPAAATLVLVRARGWTCAQSERNVSCTLNDGLPTFAASTVTVRAAIPAGASGPLENRATVAADFDNFAGNNSAVDVATITKPLPTDKAACLNGGWQRVYRVDGSSFKNQGDCIQYVNTGK